MAANPEALSRRRFAVTALSASAALFSSHRLSAQGSETLPGESVDTDTPAPKRGTNTSFAPLKQVDAGLLKVGYAEAGPADGPAVILLHGWPYDIYSFVDVVPCWQQRVTGSSFRICVALEQPVFFPARLCAMVSSRWLLSTPSLSWTH